MVDMNCDYQNNNLEDRMIVQIMMHVHDDDFNRNHAMDQNDYHANNAHVKIIYCLNGNERQWRSFQ